MTKRDDQQLLDKIRALPPGPTLPQPARADVSVRWGIAPAAHPHDEDTYEAYLVHQGRDLVGQVGFRGYLAADVPELSWGLYRPERTEGRGVMGAAFPQALRLIRDAGAVAVAAQIGTWNARSTRLAQRCGFVVISDADPKYPMWGRSLTCAP